MRISPPYFVGKLDAHREPGDYYALVLDAPLGFRDDLDVYSEAQAGLRTDGTSVGQLLDIPVIGWLTRQVLRGDQFTGPFCEPAVDHDDHYQQAKDATFWKALISPERKAADRRIRIGAMTKWVAIRVVVGNRTCWCARCVEIHERKPAASWRAWTVWALLRVAGWRAWMDNAQAAKRP